jgi:hypothetical protein
MHASVSPSTHTTCAATRRDGSPCRLPAVAGGPYCFAPDARAVEGRRRGGRQRSTAARSTRRLPPELRDAVQLVSEAMAEVRAGQLDPRRGAAIASLASALTRLIEIGELRARVEALERLAGLAGLAGEDHAAPMVWG